jgi:hypothetical protein
MSDSRHWWGGETVNACADLLRDASLDMQLAASGDDWPELSSRPKVGFYEHMSPTARFYAT